MDTLHYNQQYFDEMREYSKRGRHLKRIAQVVMKSDPQMVLDVACGHGYLVKHLRERGIDAFGIDFADPAGTEIPKEWYMKADARWIPFKDNTFDVVVSSDFFEHVPEKDIDQVAKEMQRVGRRVVALICYKHEKRSTGIDTHESVHPREWWVKRLKPYNIEII